MTDVLLYEKLPVAIRDRGDNYEVGVVVEGAFLAFGSYKANRFRGDVEEAQAAAAEAKANTKKTG